MNQAASSVPVTREILKRMEEKILQNRPQLAVIKEKYGSMSYFRYVKQKNRLNPNKHFQDRKSQLIAVIKNEIVPLLGTAIADDVERQLRKNDSVSTAEHTAPIGSVHVLNAGLHSSIPMFDNPDPRLRNLIILSCSSVSFNNELSFSRGFQLHLFKDGQINESQVTFFGRAVDPKTVLYAPPYTSQEVLDIEKRLSTSQNEGIMSHPVAHKIKALIEDIYISPHAYSASDFVDQLTITNFYLWRKLFPGFKKNQIPNYIMLSQEKVLLKLLLSYHLDQDTPIHNLLFNPKYHELTEKYFNGITGAFNKEAGTGTFLFWKVSPDNLRTQLELDNGKLVSKDASYSVELTPAAIRQAILNKELMPGLLLTFITLSFYYGLLLGGGASQPTYLTQMKNAYMKMTEELGDTQSAQDSLESVTDDFVFFRPHLAFIDAYGERISASGMDMYLYQDPSRWKEIIQATQSITIEEFITILLPILYKQFCPDDQKEEALMNIGRQDVEKFTGFDKKLPAIVTFR